MREFIGVKSFPSIFKLPTLKRDAMIFNRIAIPGIGGLMRTFSEMGAKDFYELEWLLERNILFEPQVDLKEDIKTEGIDMNAVYNLLYKRGDIGDYSKMPLDQMTTEMLMHDLTATLASSFTVREEYKTRALSVHLREFNRMDAYPIFFIELPSLQNHKAKKNEVVQITLNALPIPDDSISWEQIIEYRSDPDTNGKFLALRNWMNEVAQSNLTAVEIEDKFELAHLRLREAFGIT